MVLAAPSFECREFHRVESGDKCYKIAREYHIKTSQLRKWNPSINSSCTNLREGQVLCVGGPGKKTFKNGEGTSCLINEHCEGKLCCNPNTYKCVKDPKGTICRKHSNPSFKDLPKPSDQPKPVRAPKHEGERTCATNNDCPGVLCCHPNNKVCVRDRKGNICVDDSKPSLPDKPSTADKPNASKPNCLNRNNVEYYQKKYGNIVLPPNVPFCDEIGKTPEGPVKKPEETPKPQCMTEKQFQDVVLGSPDRDVYRYPTSGQPCDKNLCFTEGDADMVRKKFKNAPWTKDLRVCINNDQNKKDVQSPKRPSKTKCMTKEQFEGIQTWGGREYTGPLPSSGEPCDKSLCFEPHNAALVRDKYKNAPWTKDLRLCGNTDENKKEEKPGNDKKPEAKQDCRDYNDLGWEEKAWYNLGFSTAVVCQWTG